MDLSNTLFTIMVVEDDDDDFMLTELAMRRAELAGTVARTENGDQLLQVLKQIQTAPEGEQRLPSLIFLDLNMPCCDGRETLRLIRANPNWNQIPVIIFTTSTNEDDISLCYSLGANSFIRKPILLDDMVRVMQAVRAYWQQTVILAGTVT